MSGIEQEAIQVTGIAVAAAETLLANVQVPGIGLDTPLSAALVKTTPYKIVRIRGIVIVTATISYITTVNLRRGANNTTTAQVPPVPIQPAVPTAGIVGFPVPFEFIDTAPTGLTYSLTAIANTADTCMVIYNVTGWNG